MTEFYLIGYSGHAFVVAESILLNKVSIYGYFDLEEKTNNPFSLKYCGKEPYLENIHTPTNSVFFPSIGSNKIRKKIIAYLNEKQLQQTIVINPTAKISKSANVFPSCFVAANATINAMATIMDGCIINTSATIEHETVIDRYCHIAPGAVLAGNVKVGSETFIGANATVIEGRTIGSNVVIGAGAVVISNIPSNQTWVGNPAKRIK